jgi:phosphoglucosamine mutase
VAETGTPLSELAGVVQRLPQTLVNVKDVDKSRADDDQELLDAVRAAETRLGETGRVLLRPSGTEPLVRVMVEAATQDDADRVAHELAGVVSARLGLGA